MDAEIVSTHRVGTVPTYIKRHRKGFETSFCGPDALSVAQPTAQSAEG